MKSMEPNKIALQMIDFQKSAIDSSYNALVMIQGQAEKMATSLMSGNQFIPAEGQKLINEWTIAFKNGREEFKKAIDDNFKTLESFFEIPATKKASASKSKTAAKSDD